MRGLIVTSFRVLILIVIFMAGAAATVMAQPSGKGPGTVRIVASFYPVYIMARNVAKNIPGVTVTSLTPSVSGCLHDYAVTVDDLKKLAGADVFIVNGAGMESFLERVITQFPRVRVVPLAEGIPLIYGKGASGPNPHVWVSISNAILEVRSLSVAMEAIDPVHAKGYRKNSDEYILELERLRAQMQSELAPYKGQKIITFHEAFPYFAREFGFEVAAVIEREPGSDPSARELAETVDVIRSSGIRTVFIEPQYPLGAAAAIARETHVRVLTLDPAVNGEDDDGAYIRIMRKNLEGLKDAFSK